MASIPAAQRGIFIHTHVGGSPLVVQRPEGNSQTFRRGDSVIPVSGLLVVHTIDLDQQMYGIAARAANNNTAQSNLLCWLWHPANLFEMPLSQTNIENTAISALTDENVLYGFNIDDSGYGFVDKAETLTANLRCKVIQLIDAAGTIAGRAVVQPINIA